jgi:NAD(P)-dependent dehydrogenase (short-subunit alcohol dehydrogenase family)
MPSRKSAGCFGEAGSPEAVLLAGLRAIHPAMIAAGRGATVFASSIFGAGVGPARSAYWVSMAGLDALVRPITTTYVRFGIRFNTVDLVVAFLASESASYLTGQIVAVDGGVTSRLGI